MVDAENVNTPQHVEESHERNQHATHAGDALHASENNGCYEKTNHAANEIGRDTVGFMRDGGNGIRLHRIANAE